jgi:D-alanyl-D-alanine carboxypeptidase
MFRHASFFVRKLNPRHSSIHWGKFGVLLLAAIVTLTTMADARRRYVRHRYSPPASAMAIDLHTGRIIYAKNPNEPRYPASLTKVMTLHLLFDALRDGKITMTTKLRVSAHAAEQSPTKLDLSEGDTISVADAVGAVVTKSANDMAVVIAEALAGSEDEFARRMTQKARTLGMLHTTFRNASGLPNPEQQTTAQDLIILGRSILAAHPDRCKVFATRYFQYDGEVFRNHNTLLFSYEGMEGMKTGFTSASGFNLIATARRGGKRLLAVVLGGASAGSRNLAMRSILDGAWSKAMTETAAGKAGLLAAAAKPSRDSDTALPKQVQAETASKQFAADATSTQGLPAARPASAYPNPMLKLRKKPDSSSASILYASIEAALINAKGGTREGVQPLAADTTTDEPEDRAEREAVKSASYVRPAANEISGNEMLAAITAPATKNLSVHNKTVRAAETDSLAAASLDAPPEAAETKVSPPARQLSASAENHGTLPVAAAEESRRLDQPGPFHVQVGAFSDREQAQERLESVKQALGGAAFKTHPEFIMPVSLPTGATMFRARLSRFADEAQAKAVCKRLKRSGFECWDIRAQ